MRGNPGGATRGRGRALVAALAVAAVCGGARAEGPSVQTIHDWQYYNTVGWIALNRGRLDRAENAFRNAVKTLQPYEKTETRLLARSYADYAEVLVRQGKPEAAEPLARWALAVREMYPNERAEALRQNLSLLARIHHDRGKPADAEPHLRRLLGLQATHLGPGHPELIATTEVLADVLAEQGKTAEAETVYRRALLLREEHSAQNLKEAESLEHAAGIIRTITQADATAGTSPSSLQNRTNQIERMEAQARVSRESTTESVGTAATTTKFAAMLRRAGRVDEAETLEEHARELRDAAETRAARARQGR